jgi:hypothetical protein
MGTIASKAAMYDPSQSAGPMANGGRHEEQQAVKGHIENEAGDDFENGHRLRKE